MRRLAAFLCVAFAFVFFADAKKFKYSVVTESESGEGYDVSVSYPVFGGKLKAVDRKIAETVETDVEFLKRLCRFNVMMMMVEWKNLSSDEEFRAEFDSLSGGKDCELPERDWDEYKKWLMSSKGRSAFKLCSGKISELGLKLPYSYSYSLETRVFVDGSVVSVYLDVVDYSCGGNGNHEVISTVNYDLDKRKFVTAEDVTGLSTRDLAKLCASYLTSAYGEQKGRAVVDRTNKGDFPLFVLRNGTVTVFFNPYEIASGAEGVLEARIQRWQYEDVGK